MFIFYIFENVLNRIHFIQNSYVETVPENSKMKGKTVKSVYSNIKFISDVIFLRNINVTYKILICQCYIIQWR